MISFLRKNRPFLSISIFVWRLTVSLLMLSFVGVLYVPFMCFAPFLPCVVHVFFVTNVTLHAINKTWRRKTKGPLPI